MANHEGGYNLFGKLETYKDDQERLNWRGTFEEYVEKVTESPGITKSAYRTVYEAITSRPDFFTTGRNAMFGAEEVTQNFTDILRAAAEGHEIGKRIVVLLGPPGSGKSTLVNGTKAGVEAYTKTDEGAIYAIDGCPMNEEPLHVIPDDARGEFEDQLGIHIEGDLCPVCQEKYGGDNFNAETIRNMPVKRLTLSRQERRGMGTFKPSDPKSQDITELTGSPDLSKLGEYGVSSDPRAFRFDGALHAANRGVMEFVEILKSDEKFLYSLLDLTQDRKITSPRFADISADEVILAHTNLAEYNKFVKDPRNEALRDRMVVVRVPYTLEVASERKIYEKLIAQSEQVQKNGLHVNPRALDIAAMFSVLSRLEEQKEQKFTKLQKMRIYNGEDIDGLTQRDLAEMKKKSIDEGMTGISPRYIIDSLSMAITKQGGDKHCLTPSDTYRALLANINMHPHTRDMDSTAKEALIEDLKTAQEVFNEQAKREIQSAFIYSYEDTARDMSENYLAQVEAYCSKDKVIDPLTDQEHEPDEALMRSIEEQIGVSPNGKQEFRTELMYRIASMGRQGKRFDYTSHARLRQAVQSKLFADMKDIVRLTTSTRTPDAEQKERIRGVEKTLIDEHGYCEHCAGEVIRYIGALLNAPAK